MKGTEKQIAYATDIINQPIEAVNRYINWIENLPVAIASEQAQIAPLRKAVEEYRTAIKAHAEFEDAAFVIDHRTAFMSAMHNCIHKAAKEAGIVSNTLIRNIH